MLKTYKTVPKAATCSQISQPVQLRRTLLIRFDRCRIKGI
jgi:hypothetical protein